MTRARTEYRYEKLTWPEINDAIEQGQVCVVPCGAVEQHGHHLPLDVDLVCPVGIATGAGKAIPDKMLVLPVVAYGYTGHVMDFPGTINNDFEHFMHHVLDITKSLAYHGFKKIVLLNGHGSNMPNLDLVARRTNLETDAECCLVGWWNLLTVNKEFLPRWRQSKFPGGCSHACELERPDPERDHLVQRGEQPVQLGGPLRRRAGDGHLVDELVFRDRRPGRCRGGDGGKREGSLRGGGEAARALRDVVQGPAEGRAQGPPSQAADDADPLGAATGFLKAHGRPSVGFRGQLLLGDDYGARRPSLVPHHVPYVRRLAVRRCARLPHPTPPRTHSRRLQEPAAAGHV
jgi:Creatinine amidohydrolase